MARIGIWVLVPGSRPKVVVYDLSPRMRKLCGDSDSFINQAELCAAPIMIFTLPQSIANRDLLWLIDKTGAESALVKAGSPTETMCHLALPAASALAGVRARAWYEHIESDSDTYVDALSRLGLADPMVRRNVEAGLWDLVPPHRAALP